MTFGVLNGQYFSTMTTTTRSATRKAGRRMRVNRQITRFTLDCEPQSTCELLNFEFLYGLDITEYTAK